MPTTYGYLHFTDPLPTAAYFVPIGAYTVPISFPTTFVAYSVPAGTLMYGTL